MNHKSPEHNQLANKFKALGDPTRLAIFCMMLERDEACVSDISEKLDQSLANTSHHLQVMREAGFFDVKRDGVFKCYCLVQDDSFIERMRILMCTKNSS